MFDTRLNVVFNTPKQQTTQGNEMTDKQLAEMEAKAEREYRAEQAARMAQAMKAVNEVSKQHNRTAMTFGVVCK
jgi:hypothetical protein